MARGPVVEKRTAFPLPRIRRSRSLALVVLLLAACGTGTSPVDPEPPPPPPPVVPTHALTGVTPAHGTLGSRVVVTGTGFGTDPAALSVTFTGPAQGAMPATVVASSPGSLTVLVPGGVGETVQVTVSLAGVSSAALPFVVDPLVDPTPGAPGSEASAFASEADALLANVGSVLDGLLAAQLEGSGQASAAARVRSGVAQLRPAYAAALQARLAALTPEQLGVVDAILSTPEMIQARADLVAAAAALSTTPSWRSGRTSNLLGMGYDGGTVESIQEVVAFLFKAKSTMESLDNAILTAIVAAGTATIVPGFQEAGAIIPVLLDIRESVVKPIIAILDRIIDLMGTFPTRVAHGTLAVTIAENDIQLDQAFGSMADPAAAIHGVGALLVLEPYAVRGTVSFGNDGGKALRAAGSDLAPDLSGVALALLSLADFDVGNIQVSECDIRLKLLTSDPSVVPAAGGELLRIQAVAPGQVDLIVQGDLKNVVEGCVEIGAMSSCIAPEHIRIARTFLAVSGDQVAPPATLGPRLDGAQVEGRAPRTAHLGDTVVVTGRGFSRSSQIAHQDIHFEPAPGYPMSGVAYSIHQSLNDHDSFRSEVVDALPGPMTVWIQGHPSNALDFTVLPPRLDAVPPSGIVGEFWRVDGEGFSGAAVHNQADWAGFRSLPEKGSHRQLELTVPDGGLSGPFKIVTLGQLVSNAFDVKVRKFSEPAMLSAPGRTGLRPAVATDASNGARIVAWVDRNATGAAQVVTSVFPSGAAQAGTPVALPARLGGHPTAPPRPAVAAADGRFFAAWVDRAPGSTSVDRVMASFSGDGLTWSAPVAVSSHSGPSRQPVLAAHGQKVVVAWIDEPVVSGGTSAIRFRVSSDGGATFSGVWSWNGPDATDPTVAVRGNAIAIAWSSAEGSGRAISLVRSEDGGLNFQAPWRLGSVGPLAIARRPSIAIGPSCVVDFVASLYVAWEQTAGDLAEDVLFARIDGTIATQQNVTRSPVHSQSPSIVVDDDCIPALAWLEMGHSGPALLDQAVQGTLGTPLPATLKFARSFNGGVDFNERPMTLARLTDGSRLGHLSMSGGGQALLSVAWQEDFGGPPVVAFRTTDGLVASPASQPAGPVGELSADLVYRGDGADLWVSGPDGVSRLQRITRGYGTRAAPGISPDGRFLAMLPGIDQLLVAEADGAHPLRIAVTRDLMMAGSVAWSPRGDFISVASPYAPTRLSWVKPDSRGFRIVGASAPSTVMGTTGQAPWSPDGHLAFGATDSLGHVDPASNAVLPFGITTVTGTTAYSYPSWSPDGAWVAFVVGAAEPSGLPAGELGRGNVHVLEVATRFVHQLTEGGFDSMPTWSPDGSTIAFLRGGEGHHQVHVQRMDGAIGSDVNLTASLLLLDDVEPVFLPDGSGVAVYRRFVDGTTPVTVAIDRNTLAVTPLSTVFGGTPAVQHLGERPTWAADAAATVAGAATTSVNVSWNGASDDVGVDHYEIWIGDTRVVASVPGGSTSWTVTGLSPGTAYTFTVRACDAAGNCSFSGPSVGATTATNAIAPTWSVVPPQLNHGMPWSPGPGYDQPYAIAAHWTAANETGIEYRFYVNGSATPSTIRPEWGTDGSIEGVTPGVPNLITLQACFIDGACTTDGPALTVTPPDDLDPPRASGGSVSGARLTVPYDDPLDPTSLPAPTDYALTVVDGAGTRALGVQAVGYDPVQSQVVLTLASPMAAGEAGKLSYTPGASPIRNIIGLVAEAFVDVAVYNDSTADAVASAALPSGDLVVVGTIWGTARFGSIEVQSAGQTDSFVARRSASGTWLWVKRMGGAGMDSAGAVAVDAAGNILVVGDFTGSISVPGTLGPLALVPEGTEDAFVAKLDGNGEWLWATRMGGPTGPGGGAPESAKAVAVDPAGNVYAAGEFRGTVSFGGTTIALTSAGDADGWVAKLSASGAWQWANRAGGSAIDVAEAISADGTSVFVTGTFQTSMTFPGLADPLLISGWGFFLARLDATGQWSWATDASLLGGGGKALLPDGAGGVIVGGHASAISMSGATPTPWVARFTVGGTRIWQATAGTNGMIRGLAFDTTGRLHAAGQFYTRMTIGSQDLVAGPTLDLFVGRLSLVDGAWERAIVSGSEMWSFVGYGGLAPCGAGGVCLAGSAANQHPVGTGYQFGAFSHPGGSTQVFVATAGDAGAPPQLEWTGLQGMENLP